jgi:hypothetical protein
LDLPEEDLFVCNDEPEEIDDELREALARADADINAGRVYTTKQVRELMSAWRTNYSSQSAR